MADETDVTSEVARVLREHFDPTGTERHDPYAAAVYEEAATALAEAGLLRDEVTIDALNERCRILVDETDRLRAQIAAQEPAGEPYAARESVGTSDTLSARLRALVPAIYADGGYFGVTALEIGEFADEAHRLEVHARVIEQSLRRARAEGDEARAQVEAIRAAITREAAHGDAITRCNLVAERFQTVLDSVEHVIIAPTPTENPFRMPEDRA